MKKMIPIYVLLLAILGAFVFQLRETRALRTELAGIRKEQLKKSSGPPFAPFAGIPVYVTNEPLYVSMKP